MRAVPPPTDASQPETAPDAIRRKTVLALGTSALLAACGGGGSDDPGASPPPPPPGGGSLPPEQRLAALQAVATDYQRLCDGAIRADSQAVVALMRARPEYRQVTVMPDGCVCGEFIDGQIHVVANNQRTGAATARQGGADRLPRALDAGADKRVPHAKPAAVPAAAPQRVLTGVPASAAGVSVSSFVNYAQPDDGSAGEIERFTHWLSSAGVDLVPGWNPSVSNLKNLPELGFFNWLTHGGMLNGAGGITHALMTDTRADIENIVAHLPDLQAGNLVYYTGQYMYSRGKWAVDNFLAITPEFIRRYNWRFSRDSIVLVHACASDFAGFREAFRAAGAGVYGGWSHPVWVHAAVGAMHWMLDKFVASNLPVPTPSPRNRPHAYDTIQRIGADVSWMSYDDPSEGGLVEFRFTRLNDEPGCLLPSTARMEVDESQGRLTLYGSFGSTRGRVFVGTVLGTDPSGSDNYLPWRPEGKVTELPVHVWTAAAVTVDLPRTGAGSAGYIAVQVGRRWSNARALTRWNGQATVRSSGPGGLRLEHTLGYSLRADIGHWRDEPDGALQIVPVACTATPFEAPSHWTWAASGDHSHHDAPNQETTTVQWAGGRRFEMPQRSTPLDLQYYNVFGMVDRAQDQFRISIAGGAVGAMPTVEVVTNPNGSTRTDRLYNIGLPLSLSFPPATPGVPRVLGDDFSVAAGTLSSSEPTLLPLADPDIGVLEHVATWDSMRAEYPPHPNGGL